MARLRASKLAARFATTLRLGSAESERCRSGLTGGVSGPSGRPVRTWLVRPRKLSRGTASPSGLARRGPIPDILEPAPPVGGFPPGDRLWDGGLVPTTA